MINSTYYTGNDHVDKVLRGLYSVQTQLETMLNHSYFGDKKYPEEMEILRCNLIGLHGATTLVQSELLDKKGVYCIYTKEALDRLLIRTVEQKEQALSKETQTYHEYMQVLGLMI